MNSVRQAHEHENVNPQLSEYEYNLSNKTCNFV